MELELKISEEVQTVGDFIESIRRVDSDFTVTMENSDKAIIRLTPRKFDIFAMRNSTARKFVKATVDESVVNNLRPVIKMEPTILYRIVQIVLVFSVGSGLLSSLRNRDLVEIVFTFVGISLFLGVNHLVYKIGEGIFHGILSDEINDGIRKK